jgi:hypothetical protein
VEDRNAEVRVWPFGLHDDDDVPTVVPLHEASASWKPCNPAECTRDRESPSKSSALKRYRSTNLKSGDNTGLSSTITAKAEYEDEEDLLQQSTPKPPFFLILGSVDGIRDELS